LSYVWGGQPDNGSSEEAHLEATQVSQISPPCHGCKRTKASLDPHRSYNFSLRIS
jgi:hypothetical protein